MKPFARRLFPAALLCVTAALWAAPPAWWSERGIIARDASGNPLPSDNYAVANIGQAKNLAKQAYEEMKALGFIDVTLPTSSAANDLLVQQWNDLPGDPPPDEQNYAAINQGQLKNLAQPFYDRLAEFGYSGPPLEPGEIYPWSASVGAPQHHGLVNLGQLKHVFSFDVPGPRSISGLRLWLRADSETPGELGVWHDQSGNNNDVAAAAANARPLAVNDALNGHAVIRFDGIDDELVLPNVLTGAAQGEVYIVNRLRDWNVDYYGLCFFGTGYAGAGFYYDAAIDDLVLAYDSFGLNLELAEEIIEFPGPDSRVFTRPHIYNASVSPSALSLTRLDGRVTCSQQGAEVAFTNSPKLGTDLETDPWAFFPGDIAEVLVYDHVLTPAERRMLHRYLDEKYALPGIVIPAAPVLVAKATGATTVDLTWAPLAGIDQYLTAVLERKTGSGSFEVVATLESSSLPGLSSAFSYTDTGLSPSTIYSYRARFDSYAGTGAYSQIAELTTPAPTTAPVTDNLRLWLRSTAGVPTSGPVSLWADQSGMGNHATWDPIIHSSQRPELVPDALSGFPVVRFSGNQFLDLPHVMEGASEGEAFVVLKRDFSNSGMAGLWNFSHGSGGSNSYPDVTTGIIYDDFASGTLGIIQLAPNRPPPSALGSFHLYNVGGDESSWFQKLNRSPYSTASNENVSFPAYPELGYGISYFYGDMAEILIYDRLLTPQERAATEDYLTNKYTLNAPVSADGISPSTPASLQLALGTPYQATLVWPASTDNVGVVAYDVYKDGVEIASIQGLAFTAGGLIPDESYQFKVRARDAAGNVSGFRQLTLETPPAIVFDGDQDGMPDAWETAHGLNPGSAGDASGDVDGDGISNLDEFLAASNPGLQTVNDPTNSQHLRVLWP
jgi:large repetitive protein